MTNQQQTSEGPNSTALFLATGRSRKETRWRNREITWAQLVKKLQETVRTGETLREYLGSTRARQAEIKDVGGFVGGYIEGGRRKPENVKFRSLITLDIDFSPSEGLWEDFTTLYDAAAVMYPTHKHSPDSPRYRLVTPLSRRVCAEEYTAIARRVAGDVGIEFFDDTTFQPERLMYWPSTPKDQPYNPFVQEGEPLDADAVLARYENWRDASEWPVSERECTIVRKSMAKQGTPEDKPGLVGAFCRAYSIVEAIEKYLPQSYTATPDPNRYTFVEGSTAGGLVLYENRFAYSHHSTDPACGKLCNAFDLVRLHLFGAQDGDTPEETPINRLPSFTQMSALVGKDEQVRRLIISENLEAIKADFSPVDVSEDPDGEEGEGKAISITEAGEWAGKLELGKSGKAKSTTRNIRLILDNDPSLRGRFVLDAFEKREIATGNLPWRKVVGKDKYLRDVDDAGLRDYVETVYGITGVQKVKDAMDLTVYSNAVHPLKDYLHGLKWDGVPRVDTLLCRFLGAEYSEYTKAVTRKCLCAAVYRVLRPGVKYDNVLVLVGPQGAGKSTLVKKLGQEWYSDSFASIQGKEAFEQLQGVWILELGELAGLRKAEMETIKHFISKQEDRYRVAYGRRVENFPRQCIFIGTTNDLNFLSDPTGNRRFWPVRVRPECAEADLFEELTPSEVGQVWAEVVALCKAKEPLHLTRELEDAACGAQAQHTVQDDRRGLIEQYLETRLPEDWAEMDEYQRRAYLRGDPMQKPGTIIRSRVSIAEIWCELFEKNKADMSAFLTRDVRNIMRTLPGWVEAQNPVDVPGYGRQRVFRRV